MRLMIIATVLAAFAATTYSAEAAKKSKMGCEVGKQVWDAAEGKCVAGKYTKKATKKAKKEE